jgi:hypothetical protein
LPYHDPEHGFKSSCDPLAAIPASPRTGINTASRVALPLAAAVMGRTRANCARTGADPVAVPRSIPRKAGGPRRADAPCPERAEDDPLVEYRRPPTLDPHHPAAETGELPDAPPATARSAASWV